MNSSPSAPSCCFISLSLLMDEPSFHTHTHTHTHTNTQTHTHTHIHTNTNTHTYTHIHTNITYTMSIRSAGKHCLSPPPPLSPVPRSLSLLTSLSLPPPLSLSL